MTFGRVVLFAAHLPHALVGWTFGGLLLLFRRAHTPRWVEGVLTMTRREGPTRSLTFPRCIAYTVEGRGSLRVRRHELGVHVAQGEDLAAGGVMLGGVLAGLLTLAGLATPIAWWLPLALWSAVWLLAPALLVVEYFTAPLRYGVPAGERSWLARWYRVGATQSQHERSAHAQADNADWWDRHEIGGSK